MTQLKRRYLSANASKQGDQSNGNIDRARNRVIDINQLNWWYPKEFECGSCQSAAAKAPRAEVSKALEPSQGLAYWTVDRLLM